MTRGIEKHDLLQSIEHSIVTADATIAAVRKYCQEACDYGFGTVCVLPSYAAMSSTLLDGSAVRLCVGIDFPFGASSTKEKVWAVSRAIEDGASDVDVVINIGRFKSGEYNYIRDELESVVSTAKCAKGKKTDDIIVKVIIETGYLTDEEISVACSLIESAKADVAKTCTGFGPRGATVRDVTLMRSALKSDVEVKAAGGIRSLSQALELLNAGATRIGTSRGPDIFRDFLSSSPNQ